MVLESGFGFVCWFVFFLQERMMSSAYLCFKSWIQLLCRHSSCIYISWRKVNLCLTRERGMGEEQWQAGCVPRADLFLIRGIEMSWTLAYLSLVCEHLIMLFIDFQGCQICASVHEPNAGTKSPPANQEQKGGGWKVAQGKGDWNKLKWK